MFTTLRNAWKIPELRKKLLFTLLVLLIFRLGNAVPVPYVNVEALNSYFNYHLANTILGMKKAMSIAMSTLIAFALFFFILPETALAVSETVTASGTCGSALTWTLYDDGELTIEGTGPMTDYPEDYYPPCPQSVRWRDCPTAAAYRRGPAPCARW